MILDNSSLYKKSFIKKDRVKTIKEKLKYTYLSYEAHLND